MEEEKKSDQVNRRSLPIFVHYPKCGGTSVMLWFRQCLFKISDNPKLSREIRVLDSTSRSVFTLFAQCPESINKKLLIDSKTNKDVIGVRFTDLPILFAEHNINVSFAIINPAGVRYMLSNFIEVFFKNYTDHQFFSYFMSFRDPLEREVSFFTYLNSEQSKKEITHKAYDGISLESYLSTHVPDSWLLTSLVDKNSHQLNEDDFLKSINVLEKVDTCHVSDLSKAFQAVLYKSESFPREEYKSLEYIVKERHNITINKPTEVASSLDKDILNTFQKRKAFEYRLHDFLEKKSQKLELTF